MGGTQLSVESLVGLVAQTVLTSTSDEKNSLEGIDVSGLVDGATCYVREFVATYRYFEASAEPVNVPFVVAPSVGPGRWIAVASDVLIGGDSASVNAGFEDLTSSTTQVLGATGAWVNLVTPSWGSILDQFTSPSNGEWEYPGAIDKKFLLSAQVSMAFASPLMVSVGISIGGDVDPAPQTILLTAGVDLQCSTSRVDVMRSVASGGGVATVQLRSSGAGAESVTVISSQMIITPAD